VSIFFNLKITLVVMVTSYYDIIYTENFKHIYDNNVITIWKMLIVVCNRSTKSQLTWSRTNDDHFKTFDLIPYAILIKSITQIMA